MSKKNDNKPTGASASGLKDNLGKVKATIVDGMFYGGTATMPAAYVQSDERIVAVATTYDEAANLRDDILNALTGNGYKANASATYGNTEVGKFWYIIDITK